MATALVVMVALAISWLMLGLLARPSGKDKHARETPATPVRVPRPRPSAPAPGFRTPTLTPPVPPAPVRTTATRPATELASLLAAEVSAAEADRVLGLAGARHLSPELLNRWAHRFGVQRMILVVDAGVGESALRRHLRDKTQPDWAALKVFADLARVKSRILTEPDPGHARASAN